ncbi:hypothetical protein ACFOWA_09560 [Pedobacter lithocola]|uniref:Lipoprotein n=1 Tax=Pedobacter lithocola TaxID=1908239 RepID=A0ABV8P901_9SPHI
MNRLFYIVAIVTILLSACQSDSKKYTTVDSSIMSNQQAPYKSPDECFIYTKNRDTATLLMYGSADKILGELRYNFYEKDKNSGVIYGVLKGDTITVDYKFQSEGVYSHREIVWVRKGDTLLEGSGDVYEENGNVKFKNKRKLTFGKGIVFTKTKCK